MTRNERITKFIVSKGKQIPKELIHFYGLTKHNCNPDFPVYLLDIEDFCKVEEFLTSDERFVIDIPMQNLLIHIQDKFATPIILCDDTPKEI